jgi:hypothetical protein
MLQDFHDRGIYLSEDQYSTGLRSLFPEAYQEFADDVLEDILYSRIAQLSPSEAESFFGSVGDFFKNHVAPVAVAALPAVTTIAGTALGGPVGGALGKAVGGFASNAISKGTNIQPNPLVSNIAGAASSIAGGNIRGAIPGLINAGQSIGNAISPGAGNTIAGIANMAQGLIPGGAGMPAAATAPNQNPATSQLLSFLRSTPFLQSMLSAMATGNMGTALQIPKEDGSLYETNYMEMLESLKHLTENALIEADNLGFSSGLPIESEADKDAYIESVIESVSAYENSLLPNYDNILYN